MSKVISKKLVQSALGLSFLGLGLMGASLNASALDVEAKYKSTCFACHGTGAAGAPLTGNTDAWAPRLEKGMDALVGAVKTGVGAMPPGGLCGDCSDDDFKTLIEFMAK